MTELIFRNDDGPQRYEALSGDAIAGKMYWVDASEAEQPERGFRIVPVCPYVKAWLKRHDDYAQHAVAVRPRHLEAVQARQRRSS